MNDSLDIRLAIRESIGSLRVHTECQWALSGVYSVSPLPLYVLCAGNIILSLFLLVWGWLGQRNSSQWGRLSERGRRACTPPSPSLAENTIMTECTQESSHRQSIWLLVCDKKISWESNVSRLEDCDDKTRIVSSMRPHSYSLVSVWSRLHPPVKYLEDGLAWSDYTDYDTHFTPLHFWQEITPLSADLGHHWNHVALTRYRSFHPINRLYITYTASQNTDCVIGKHCACESV